MLCWCYAIQDTEYALELTEYDVELWGNCEQGQEISGVDQIATSYGILFVDLNDQLDSLLDNEWNTGIYVARFI